MCAWTQNLLLPESFDSFNIVDKLAVVLEGSFNVKYTAKFILKAMDIRSKAIKNSPSSIIYHTDPEDECLACNMAISSVV